VVDGVSVGFCGGWGCGAAVDESGADRYGQARHGINKGNSGSPTVRTASEKTEPESTQPVESPKAPEPVQQLQTAVEPKPVTAFQDTLKDGSQGPEMVVIPGGEFMMGSPEDEEGRVSDEGPQGRRAGFLFPPFYRSHVPRGNAAWTAPAVRTLGRDAEHRGMHSHAGAWGR
jgi:formylglycine-generating enzyme required for sulfatase activity